MTRLGRGAGPAPTGSAALVVEDDPDPDDLALLESRVVESTFRSAGIDDDRDLAILLRDPDGRVLAGVSGGTWGGCCELSHLWVDDGLRGQGLGSALVRAAEDEARRRGCGSVVLFTHDVQVRGFYERLGYETVGIVDDYPTGSAARWFRKRLTSPNAET